METSAERKFFDGSRHRTSNEMEVFRNELASATSSELQMMVVTGLSRKPTVTKQGNLRLLFKKLGDTSAADASLNLLDPLEALPVSDYPLVPEPPIPPIGHSDVVEHDEEDVIDCTRPTRINPVTSLASNTTRITGVSLRSLVQSICVTGDPFDVNRAMKRMKELLCKGDGIHTEDSEETMKFFQKVCEGSLKDSLSLKERTFMIIGSPGSGKSFAINCLSKALGRAGGTVLSTTMTNAASLQINST